MGKNQLIPKKGALDRPVQMSNKWELLSDNGHPISDPMSDWVMDIRQSDQIRLSDIYYPIWLRWIENVQLFDPIFKLTLWDY